MKSSPLWSLRGLTGVHPSCGWANSRPPWTWMGPRPRGISSSSGRRTAGPSCTATTAACDGPGPNPTHASGIGSVPTCPAWPQHRSRRISGARSAHAAVARRDRLRPCGRRDAQTLWRAGGRRDEAARPRALMAGADLSGGAPIPSTNQSGALRRNRALSLPFHWPRSLRLLYRRASAFLFGAVELEFPMQLAQRWIERSLCVRNRRYDHLGMRAALAFGKRRSIVRCAHGRLLRPRYRNPRSAG
jgi:hypothetical protein